MELDHVGVTVGDLDAAAQSYTRLGFNLTPRSLHSGSLRPGGPVEPWGSGNHCAMFRDGYLEIQGITDPALYSPAKQSLARYEGAHIVAINCPDAAAAYELAHARGAAVSPPIRLERQASYGENNETTRLAQFDLVYADRAHYAEARFLIIKHLTPDVLWQAWLLDHPNGAIALDETWICAADPLEASRRVAPLFGVEPTISDDLPTVELARGRLLFVAPHALDARLPGARAPCLPYVAGFGIAVQDISQTEELFAREKIPFVRQDGALFVGGAMTSGPHIRFHQS
jgi:catechol 2,3-dioxygenase-like lactoylglutathione lyase family enzyme